MLKKKMNARKMSIRTFLGCAFLVFLFFLSFVFLVFLPSQSLYETVQSKDDNLEAFIGECEDRALKLQRDFHVLCKEHR